MLAHSFASVRLSPFERLLTGRPSDRYGSGDLQLRTQGVGNPLALSIKAGVAYAVTVFAIGVLLGTARVLLLAPRAGSTVAVSVETPIILAASWRLSRIWTKRLAVGMEIRTRILVGGVAFVTLMLLEVALSVIVFHRSIAEYLAELRSPAGAIGFAAQVCFATFPLLNVIGHWSNGSNRR